MQDSAIPIDSRTPHKIWRLHGSRADTASSAWPAPPALSLDLLYHNRKKFGRVRLRTVPLPCCVYVETVHWMRPSTSPPTAVTLRVNGGKGALRKPRSC